jgi:hypothetical protein
MMDRYRTWLYVHTEPILAAILVLVVILGFLLILST